METIAFIADLKAKGSENGVCDLAKTFEEYKDIVKSLSPKDKGNFSLSVLCMLIRNSETVPKWSDNVNIKELLSLSIECVRHTRSLDKEHQIKALGCIFRLHKHIVTKKSPTPPELVLKLSFMPFEYDDESLLNEYYKTYGHIIIDRITYIEKLKSTKLPISKLLPKLIEDITKVIKIYDTVQFCINMLTFLVKKLTYIYNESPEELNDSFGKIFDSISKNDLKLCQKIADKDALDLYVKLNECLYTVTENSSKNNFKNSILNSVTRVCVSLLGHKPDMFHCFQTIYLNTFCCIFNDKTSPILIDNLLKNLLTSCEMTEKLGYKSTMYLTYPFISQLMRLFIEHNKANINNHEKSDNLNESIQENCLKLVLFLLEKLKKTKQLTKCENCTIKTGLHDAFRLSLSVKHFITISTNKNIELKNNLPIYFKIVEEQYLILDSLLALRCSNHERCFKLLQTDVHNTAVILNKYIFYEHSIKLFEIYLKNEIKSMKSDAEMRNISRALYNKSICELDAKLYKTSLLNAFLSLVFSLPEGLKLEKYMSLVMDVKAKALKSDDNSDETNELQSLSILQACDLLYNDEVYGNLKMFLKNLKFSSLLKHEFSMYVKLWASIVPISGVWRSLLDLTKNKYHWIKAEDKEVLLWTLYEVVLETPTVVRNIHDDCYKSIVTELVINFQNTPELSTREELVYGTILLLKSEYDMAEASLQHGWKVTEHTTDPDKDETIRTMQQEHNAIGAAVQAVEVFTDVVSKFESGILPNTTLSHIAQIMCVSVQQLLHLHMFAHGLQLAYTGCCIADGAGDKESYILHASALIYHAQANKQIESILIRAMKYAAEFIRSGQNLEAALCLICDVAIYYIKSGSVYMASKLIQFVQAKLLAEFETLPDANLELSLGRLMEAQAMLCPDSGLSTLSAVNALPRHYLAVRNTATRYALRRMISLYIKTCITSHGCAGVRLSRRLALWRRAYCAAAATLPPAGAAARARVYADIINTHDTDAQVKIALHLKYILKSDVLTVPGETIQNESLKQKQEQFLPKQDNVEIMLDSMFQKTQISNEESIICSIPAFKSPDFFQHAKTCACYACMSPACMIIACQISYLEASTYFRAKEIEIAKNYFDGALKTFGNAEEKLKNIFSTYKTKKFSELVIDTTKRLIEDEFKTVQLEFLIELSFFELSRIELEKCDEHVVSIHEILSEFKNVDPYLKNEVANLMIAAANVRKTKVIQETGLEIDMEELKLSPDKLKTPETKTKMPVICHTVKVVKSEELHNLAKAIRFKLDFDAANEIENTEIQERNTEKKQKQSKFKVPVPVTSKPLLENLTPRPSRVKPKIIITQQSQTDTEISTPKTEPNFEFFTPCQSTPAKFFTPMSNVKTYSKKRNLVVKNLENEFSTPKGKVELDSKSVQHTPIKDLKSVEDDLKPVKDDLTPFKDDLKPVKDDLKPVKDDLKPVKEDLGLENDLRAIKDGVRPKSAPAKEDSRVKKEDSGRRTRSRVEMGSIKCLSDKRALKRATSPGKLVDETKPVSRTRRVKQPGFE
ncbi:uncharacterized protein LOC123878816 isoform X2 [Maniola jurtina]|uniref:uncharacterized protein LOC123878816 isoform X2 n=1 Tax=Maniola jurtina TaxID=191418 RepID=UPI001E685E72|nr:uncharacterized protein LOC123878816 isoform X2 [Maniola jurtina]